MRKTPALIACLLLACALSAALAGCGCEEGGGEQEPGTSTKVEVPDVRGLSVEDAERRLTDSDLDCAVRSGDGDGTGTVLEQDPGPGTLMTPDMTVYITIGE